MKIGFLSYAMLFQRTGGLQIQMLETIRSLNNSGQEARLINPAQDQLSDFDLVHIFSVLHGNHRAVETARDQNVPVVLSPLLQSFWTPNFHRKARILETLVGRTTGWKLKTEFNHLSYCLTNADALIALGHREAELINKSFNVDPKIIHNIPNGIPERFFTADPTIFSERFNIEPGFVLNVASISSQKNQLALVNALKGSNIPIVLIGPASKNAKPYLDTILSFPQVKYIGPLEYEDPALASAYAAAAVFCLPSKSEVMPLSTLEALAAGTPVVMTNHHGMDYTFNSPGLKFIDPTNLGSIKKEIIKYIEEPDKKLECRSVARQFSWDGVAKKLVCVYEKILNR